MKLVLFVISLAAAAAANTYTTGRFTSFSEAQQFLNGADVYSFVNEAQNSFDEPENPKTVTNGQEMKSGNLIIADEPNHPEYSENDDMEDLSRSTWCRSLGGMCRTNKTMPTCPGGYLESAYGRPYCMGSNRRCCYPLGWCTSRSGHCRKLRKPCPHGDTASPSGKPYCMSKKKRCCYPASSTTTSTLPSTTPPSGNCTSLGGTQISYAGLSYCLRRTCTPWNDTLEWCDKMDMTVAQPKDPNGLARYINSLGLSCWYWLDGNGDGSNQVWGNGTVISNTDPLWSTSPNVNSSYCVALTTCRNLTKTLITYKCQTDCGYRLCQGRSLATSSSPATTIATTITTTKTTTTTTTTSAPTTTPTPAGNCTSHGGTQISYSGLSYCLRRTCTPWNDTLEWCNKMGMAVALPKDPNGLARYINSLGLSCWYWLDGNGDGSNQVWGNGTVISNTDPLWSTSPNVNSSYCLALTTCRNLTKILITYKCQTDCGYRLCQGKSITTTTVTPPSTTPAPVGNCTSLGGTAISYSGLSYCLRRTCTPWNDTLEWCNNMGMAVALPKDPNGLARYINSLRLYCTYWLDGNGDGSNQVWGNGTVISNTDPLWSSYRNVDSSYCLALITCGNLTKTLITFKCHTDCGYRLCQARTSRDSYEKKYTNKLPLFENVMKGDSREDKPTDNKDDNLGEVEPYKGDDPSDDSKARKYKDMVSDYLKEDKPKDNKDDNRDTVEPHKGDDPSDDSKARKSKDVVSAYLKEDKPKDNKDDNRDTVEPHKGDDSSDDSKARKYKDVVSAYLKEDKPKDNKDDNRDTVEPHKGDDSSDDSKARKYKDVVSDYLKEDKPKDNKDDNRDTVEPHKG